MFVFFRVGLRLVCRLSGLSASDLLGVGSSGDWIGCRQNALVVTEIMGWVCVGYDGNGSTWSARLCRGV